MAQDASRMVLMLGVIGVGGYVAYEYMQYQTGISNLNKADPSGATSAAVEAILPFTTWLMQVKLNFSTVNNLTAQQSNALAALENAMAGVVVMPPTPTPGTTPAMSSAGASTSVSTTPTTTPTTGGTTTASSTPMVSQPTAADLQHSINMNLANADQWNYAYKQLMGGAGIESVYGFNFDAVYGAVQGQTRSSGMMTAQAFLNAPGIAGFTPASGVRRTNVRHTGMGAIAHFYSPVTRSVGSMLYSAQHPSPYRQPSYNLAGFIQPTGFEMALLGGQSLRSNRII